MALPCLNENMLTVHWLWWYPVIPALKGLRREDLGQSAMQNKDPVSKLKTTKHIYSILYLLEI